MLLHKSLLGLIFGGIYTDIPRRYAPGKVMRFRTFKPSPPPPLPLDSGRRSTLNCHARSGSAEIDLESRWCAVPRGGCRWDTLFTE